MDTVTGSFAFGGRMCRSGTTAEIYDRKEYI